MEVKKPGDPRLSLPPREKIAVALDNVNISEAEGLIQALLPYAAWFKVAASSFCRHGHDIVRVVKNSGALLFLDLKFHDVPSQVAGGVAAAREMGASMLTIHASGGQKMIRAAVAEKGPEMRLIAATVLTSLDQEEVARIWPSEELCGLIKRLVDIAFEAGADGAVVSAKEVASLRKHLPKDFWLVVPGLRPEGQELGDQARVGTPGKALEDGADIIVLGRAVTGAADPVSAFKALFRQGRAE